MSHLILHPKQKEIVQSKDRFKVIRAGRRSGKTSLQVEDMVFKAVTKKDRLVFYIAPTQKQARSIIWEMLKKRLAGIGEANEGRLEMKVPTKEGGYSNIFVSGWENRENFRGMKAHMIVFDELDTMKDFFIGWQEIFRPALTDTGGQAVFIGTPKKENPNLRRLEKISEEDDDYEAFHFTTEDNPYIDPIEIAKAKKELDYETFKQEFLAEYIEDQGALFRYTSLVDVFSNTVAKNGSRYLSIDVADDGSDKTIFSFWEDLEEYRREEFARLNTESIIAKTREYASQDRIPFSHIIVDAIGVGAGVASSSLLDGAVGFKGSYQAIKTDMDIIRLPNVHYLDDPMVPRITDFRNLRNQCLFTLADKVNNHKIASRVEGQFKEYVIEELHAYQDVSKGDGKRMATPKEEVREIIGRSPDHCLVAGTKILTDSGHKNIEDIRIGDKVITPFGIKKVIRAGKTHKNVFVDKIKISNGAELVGTSGHKIYTKRGFHTIDRLIIRDKIEVYSKLNILLWKLKKYLINASDTTTKNIGFRKMVDTGMRVDLKHCIARFGKIIIRKKFLKNTAYTILTATRTITILKIWKWLLMRSILATTENRIGNAQYLGAGRLKTLIKQELKQQNGTKAEKEKNGIAIMEKNYGKINSQNKLFALFAEKRLAPLGQEQSFALINVAKNIIIKAKNITRKGIVLFARKSLKLKRVRKQKPALCGAGHYIAGIKKNIKLSDVYNLTVEKDNVYYANGILVSNSDTWQMRMYFELMKQILPAQSEENSFVYKQQQNQFLKNKANFTANSNK